MDVSECPQCGAPAKPSQRNCEFCKAEFFITSVAYLGKLDQGGINKYLQHYKKLTKENPDDAEGYLGLGITFLQLGMFPLALKSFERVIELSPEIPQSYYYASLAKIQGRRLMTLSLKEAKDVESLANTAAQIDPGNPTFTLLLALIRRDYYEANGMKSPAPNAEELLATIQGREIETKEVDRLKAMVLVRQDFFSEKLKLV